MYKKIISLLALSCSLCTQGFAAKENRSNDVEIPEWTQARILARGMYRFAHKLRPHLLNEEGNALFSPFSIYSCLGMIYAGANGETEEEMRNVMSLKLSQDEVPMAVQLLSKSLVHREKSLPAAPIVKVSNALFFDPRISLTSSYQETLTNLFNAKTMPIDARNPENTIAAVNEWVSSNTEGKISHLLDKSDISENTRLLLVNTLYFQGKWAKPFKTSATECKPFHVTETETVPVEMMEQVGRFPYAENEFVQVVGLPLEGPEKGEYILWLFLKKQQRCGTHCELGEEKRFAKERAFAMQESLKHKEIVRVAIPQLLQRLRYELNEPLANMGMASAFTDRADFSKMSDAQGLAIDKIIHEIYFCLNETGITAAAATSGGMGITSMPGEDHGLIAEFIADRPFSFMLTETGSHIPLFSGTIRKPNPTPCS